MQAASVSATHLCQTHQTTLPPNWDCSREAVLTFLNTQFNSSPLCQLYPLLKPGHLLHTLSSLHRLRAGKLQIPGPFPVQTHLQKPQSTYCTAIPQAGHFQRLLCCPEGTEEGREEPLKRSTEHPWNPETEIPEWEKPVVCEILLSPHTWDDLRVHRCSQVHNFNCFKQDLPAAAHVQCPGIALSFPNWEILFPGEKHSLMSASSLQQRICTSSFIQSEHGYYYLKTVFFPPGSCALPTRQCPRGISKPFS